MFLMWLDFNRALVFAGKAVQFLISPCRQKVFEVLQFKEEPRSWFVEDSVQRGNDHKVKLAEINDKEQCVIVLLWQHWWTVFAQCLPWMISSIWWSVVVFSDWCQTYPFKPFANKTSSHSHLCVTWNRNGS